ncbi:MAG: hypothetical protein M3071_07595 [Actinomycetota bacterium]|nr:hypothetical protein [Actinomycetota bacterium]
MSSAADSTDPPGAVSNQNQEEAEGGRAGHGGADPGLRPDEEAEGGAGESGGPSGDSAPGAASEGSQATGHPENAG